MDVLACQDHDDITILALPLPPGREAVHLAEEEAEDVGAAAAVDGPPAADDYVRVVDEDHGGRRGLGCREDLDDVGVHHHLAHSEELALQPVSEPAAHGRLARPRVAMYQHAALGRDAQLGREVGVLQREEHELLELFLDAPEAGELVQVHVLYVVWPHGRAAHDGLAHRREERRRVRHERRQLQRPAVGALRNGGLDRRPAHGGAQLRGRELGVQGAKRWEVELRRDLCSHPILQDHPVVSLRRLAQGDCEGLLKEGLEVVLDGGVHDDLPRRRGHVAQGLEQQCRLRQHVPVPHLPGVADLAHERARALEMARAD
mmetsp:Transcript_108844/g.318472  ORF Transcript_108844/g.318472 Transcript_108844/m.318472 type:complete len:317 (-) Transcript_108844:418-1368(-)